MTTRCLIGVDVSGPGAAWVGARLKSRALNARIAAIVDPSLRICFIISVPLSKMSALRLVVSSFWCWQKWMFVERQELYLVVKNTWDWLLEDRHLNAGPFCLLDSLLPAHHRRPASRNPLIFSANLIAAICQWSLGEVSWELVSCEFRLTPNTKLAPEESWQNPDWTVPVELWTVQSQWGESAPRFYCRRKRRRCWLRGGEDTVV